MTATNAPSYATELRAEQKAHEPSMEDILASIRRMIADDDVLPLSRRARSRLATPEAAEAASPPKAPADAFLSLVHRLGRESGGQTSEILPAAAAVADAPAQVVASLDESKAARESAPLTRRTPTLKLRDFALPNFMARSTLPQDEAAQDTPAQTVAEPEAASASLPAENLRPSLGEADTPVEPAGEPSLAPTGASVVMLPPRPSHTAEIRLKIAPLTFRAPSFAAPSSLSVAPAPDPEPVAEKSPAPAPAEAALLSPASDAKIGASFEALAETLLARDKDLVERAARDMLRPMLKSWLDDNLPSLVERLVRAEIERVARDRG